MIDTKRIRGILFDLDGTVYSGPSAIPGAAEFVSRLTIPYLFVTNRGSRTPETVAAQLQDMGIACNVENILTSSQVVARRLQPGTRVCCIGEVGVTEVLTRQGIEIVPLEAERADCVVVGHDSDFNYRKIADALRHIRNGARFIATNEDAVITEDGEIVPEAGPIVAAISVACGSEPETMGKPHRPIIEAALGALGVQASEALLIGDNPDTDIAAANRAGLQSVLMLTGVATRESAAINPAQADLIATDYAELTEILSGLLS